MNGEQMLGWYFDYAHDYLNLRMFKATPSFDMAHKIMLSYYAVNVKQKDTCGETKYKTIILKSNESFQHLDSPITTCVTFILRIAA